MTGRKGGSDQVAVTRSDATQQSVRLRKLGPAPMRVLIVDDHPIVASGCRALLAGELDINLPTVSGFELARRILARAESARIIMFSMNDDPVFAARAINSGAKGYVSKSGDP